MAPDGRLSRLLSRRTTNAIVCRLMQAACASVEARGFRERLSSIITSAVQAPVHRTTLVALLGAAVAPVNRHRAIFPAARWAKGRQSAFSPHTRRHGRVTSWALRQGRSQETAVAEHGDIVPVDVIVGARIPFVANIHTPPLRVYASTAPLARRLRARRTEGGTTRAPRPISTNEVKVVHALAACDGRPPVLLASHQEGDGRRAAYRNGVIVIQAESVPQADLHSGMSTTLLNDVATGDGRTRPCVMRDGATVVSNCFRLILVSTFVMCTIFGSPRQRGAFTIAFLILSGVGGSAATKLKQPYSMQLNLNTATMRSGAGLRIADSGKRKLRYTMPRLLVEKPLENARACVATAWKRNRNARPSAAQACPQRVLMKYLCQCQVGLLQSS